MSQDPFQQREAEKYANPIPSREFILDFISKREKPVSRDELAVALNIEGDEQQEALRRRLRAMERDGQLVFTRRQCYALPEPLNLGKAWLSATATASASCASRAVKTIFISPASR